MGLCKIGIIGGGPGGLMTAYFLDQIATMPFQATIFEASSRLGGKICTPRFDKVPVAYEAGAAEFYDYSPVDDDPLKELIHELGLSISPMGGSGVIQHQQVLANVDDLRARLGESAQRAYQQFDQQAKDWMSPWEYYLNEHPQAYRGTSADQSFDQVIEQIADPTVRNYLHDLIHSDLATEPNETSIAYGLQNYLMNDARYMQLYSIVGGNEQLVQELARRISARVKLEHAVQSISRQADGRLAITTQQGHTQQTEAFDYVVIALPNNYLPKLHFADAELQQTIQKHHEHFNFPAHYLRVTLLFETPFWRNQLSDSFWMLDQLGGCCLYDESSRVAEPRYGILGWLLGGKDAEQLSSLSDAELIDRALDSLPEFMSAARGQLIEGKVHRWLNAVNGNPGGRSAWPLARRHQPDIKNYPDLFLVGDYLYDSTLNGVLDAADYVAHWLASLLSENSPLAKRKPADVVEQSAPYITEPSPRRNATATGSVLVPSFAALDHR
jgi:monoamine oxidase